MPSLKILHTVRKLINSELAEDLQLAAHIYWGGCSLKMKKRMILYFMKYSELELHHVDPLYAKVVYYSVDVDGEKEYQYYSHLTDIVLEKIKSVINKQTQL